jgi:hypothetical protein
MKMTSLHLSAARQFVFALPRRTVTLRLSGLVIGEANHEMLLAGAAFDDALQQDRKQNSQATRR